MFLSFPNRIRRRNFVVLCLSLIFVFAVVCGVLLTALRTLKPENASEIRVKERREKLAVLGSGINITDIKDNNLLGDSDFDGTIVTSQKMINGGGRDNFYTTAELENKNGNVIDPFRALPPAIKSLTSDKYLTVYRAHETGISPVHKAIITAEQNCKFLHTQQLDSPDNVPHDTSWNGMINAKGFLFCYGKRGSLLQQRQDGTMFYQKLGDKDFTAAAYGSDTLVVADADGDIYAASGGEDFKKVSNGLHSPVTTLNFISDRDAESGYFLAGDAGGNVFLGRGAEFIQVAENIGAQINNFCETSDARILALTNAGHVFISQNGIDYKPYIDHAAGEDLLSGFASGGHMVISGKNGTLFIVDMAKAAYRDFPRLETAVERNHDQLKNDHNGYDENEVINTNSASNNGAHLPQGKEPVKADTSVAMARDVVLTTSNYIDLKKVKSFGSDGMMILTSDGRLRISRDRGLNFDDADFALGEIEDFVFGKGGKIFLRTKSQKIYSTLLSTVYKFQPTMEDASLLAGDVAVIKERLNAGAFSDREFNWYASKGCDLSLHKQGNTYDQHNAGNLPEFSDLCLLAQKHDNASTALTDTHEPASTKAILSPPDKSVASGKEEGGALEFPTGTIYDLAKTPVEFPLKNHKRPEADFQVCKKLNLQNLEDKMLLATFALELDVQGQRDENGELEIFLVGNGAEASEKIYLQDMKRQHYRLLFAMPGEVNKHSELYLNFAYKGKGGFTVDHLWMGKAKNSPHELSGKTCKLLTQLPEHTVLRLPYLKIGQGDAAWSNQGTYNLGQNLLEISRVKARPWLVIDQFAEKQEIHNLMEYLAGDISTIYGSKRMAEGFSGRYSDLFDMIYVEVSDQNAGVVSDILKQKCLENVKELFRNTPEYESMAGKIVFVDGMSYQNATLYAQNSYIARDIVLPRSFAGVIGLEQYLHDLTLQADILTVNGAAILVKSIAAQGGAENSAITEAKSAAHNAKPDTGDHLKTLLCLLGQKTSLALVDLNFADIADNNPVFLAFSDFLKDITGLMRYDLTLESYKPQIRENKQDDKSSKNSKADPDPNSRPKRYDAIEFSNSNQKIYVFFNFAEETRKFDFRAPFNQNYVAKEYDKNGKKVAESGGKGQQIPFWLMDHGFTVLELLPGN